MSVEQEKEALFERFTAVMSRCGDDDVEMIVDVDMLLSLVGGLQLALRHPNYPTQAGERLMHFISDAQDRLASIDPVFAEVIAKGFDPQFDDRIGGPHQ